MNTAPVKSSLPREHLRSSVTLSKRSWVLWPEQNLNYLTRNMLVDNGLKNLSNARKHWNGLYNLLLCNDAFTYTKKPDNQLYSIFLNGLKWITPVDYLTHWPIEQSRYDPLVTHMLKFYFLKVTTKILICKTIETKQNWSHTWLLLIRVESGLHASVTHLTHWLTHRTIQMHVTHIWPICDPATC